MRKFGRMMVITLLVLLTAFPAATAEGTFKPLPMDLSGGAPYDGDFASNMFVYEDPTIRVERSREIQNPDLGTPYYAVDIQVKDASQIRTASADASEFLTERRIHAEVIARRVNAVFAMNGDYSGDYHGNESTKHVLRQGILFRDTVDTRLDMLMIDEDGDFHILPGGEELATVDKTQVDGKKIVNVLQFGPGLVVDGKPAEEEYILSDDHSPQYAKPAGKAVRVCLLQMGPLHYKAICTKYAINMAAFQKLILTEAPDCINAYVLDGGGSAQFVYLGRIVNHLNSKNNPNLRRVSDIVYFASAWFQEE